MSSFLRKSIEARIRGEGGGGPLGAILGPLSSLYGLGVGARLGLYRAGVLKPRRLSCGVISVGNITVGGSGKTPITMFIASYLKERGAKVAVVSRGYGGTQKGLAVVGDGKDVLLGAREAGDEPVLMARRLEGVPVITGADRYSAGLFAMERFGAEVIVLDDGFQHIALHRDLNILLMDGGMSLSRARLLPAGPLREPVSAIGRAHLVLVKGGCLTTEDSELVSRYGLMRAGFTYRPRGLTDLLSGKSLEVEALRNRPLLALSAIAGPGSFFGTLEGLGLNVVGTMTYPDHHAYGPQDIEAVREKMDRTGAEAIITTEKDGVKLGGLVGAKGPEVYALVIDVEIKEMGALRAALSPFARERAGKEGGAKKRRGPSARQPRKGTTGAKHGRGRGK